MLKEKEIVENILKGINESFQTKLENKTLIITTPFFHPDGDYIDVFLSEENGEIRLTDAGLTFMKLSGEALDYRTDARTEIVNNILATYNMKIDSGELTIKTDLTHIGADITMFLQGLVKIVDLLFTKKEVARSVLLEELDVFLHEKIRDKEIHKNWTHPELDREKYYPVDFHIRDGKNPVFLFGVTSSGKCKDATITCYHYKRLKFDFLSIGVFDRFEEIYKRDEAKLMDVSDKLFSEFKTNQEDIIKYIYRFLSIQ
jgi:hypothetical protein